MTGLLPKKNGGKIDMDAFFAKTAALEKKFKEEDKEKEKQRQEKAHARTIVAAEDVIKHSNGSTKNESEKTTNEYEVYRITPEVGKCYVYAEYEKKTGTYKEDNERYFSETKKPEYVGQCTSMVSEPNRAFAVFKNGDKEKTIHFSYEGKTCFREVPCQEENKQEEKKGGKKKKRRTLKKRKTKKNKKKKSRKTKSKK